MPIIFFIHAALLLFITVFPDQAQQLFDLAGIKL
jgi:hypothetical protein